ncbi:damage-inducible protein DinB [Ahrensia sp. AH-315-G08]|nr:damage-inducible protein DinB [Ahrensia sp. AH-315-G08]
MINNFKMFARYNAWANDRLYEAAAALSDAQYNADCRAFFKSMNGTLNHILVADLVWMGRFENTNGAPRKLDANLHEEFSALRSARIEMDQHIIDYCDGLSRKQVEGSITYTPITIPEEVTIELAPALSHVFNHQTHHRGQSHAILTQLTGEAPAIDLIYYNIAR